MATTLITQKMRTSRTLLVSSAYGARRRTAILNAAIIGSVGALMLGSTYLYVRDANSVPLAFEAATGTGVAHAASAYDATSSPASALREVHIANDGLALVRGAYVDSVSAGTIDVSITWGSAELRWAVKTDNATSFYATDGEKGSLDGIYPGQYLSSITGQIDPGAAQPTIHASFVRS